jgi:serine/threonine-protein kinase
LVVLFNFLLINQSNLDLPRALPGFLPDWSEYKNSKYKIKVKYPKTWNYQLKDNPWGESFVIFIPLNHQQSGVKVAISVEPMPDLISLEEYTKIFKKRVLEHNEECKLIEQKDSLLLHTNAYTVVYEFKYDNKRVKKMAILALRDKKAYIVYYEAKPYSFSKFEPVVKTLVNSLEIINH